MKTGQISLEFIIAISLVIFIFLIFFSFYLEKNASIRVSDKVIKLKRECFRVSNALSSAVELGDGAVEGFNTSSVCSYRGDIINSTFTGRVNIINNNGFVTIKNA